MRTFKDKTGADWTIELSFGAVLRVKSLSDGKYDLLRPERQVDHEELGKVPFQVVVGFDFPTLFEVLVMTIDPQLKAAGVTAEQFAERIADAVLVKIRTAFLEEWRDFFLSLQRPDQAKTLEKLSEWLTMGKEKLEAAIANLNMNEMDKTVATMMDKSLTRMTSSMPSGISGNSVESAG